MTNREARKLMKLHGHTFDYCRRCDVTMIVCGYCGNNCCNGGSRDNCKDDCDEAYEIQSCVNVPLIYRIRELISNLIYRLFRIFNS